MSPGLLLAVVLGAGSIPIPSSIERFPDPRSWPGERTQQVANMLAEIQRKAAPMLRTSGPGPAQLAARWRAGKLNLAERPAVLLAGATFHDLVLLPAYIEALQSPLLRERQAAMVGLAWLIGDATPDPTRFDISSPVWEQAATFARRLEWVTDGRPLIQMWIDSYLEARGLPTADYRRGLDRSPEECLAAIREIAQPEDLGDLFALWPMLDRGGRYHVLRTIELVTVRQLREERRGPRVATGEWIEANAAQLVDQWVGNACTSVDGVFIAEQAMQAIAGAMGGSSSPSAPGVAALSIDYPSMWPVAAEWLIGFGAPAVAFNRQFLTDPTNRDAARRVLDAFPVTDEQLEWQRTGHRPTPRRAKPPRRR